MAPPPLLQFISQKPRGGGGGEGGGGGGGCQIYHVQTRHPLPSRRSRYRLHRLAEPEEKLAAELALARLLDRPLARSLAHSLTGFLPGQHPGGGATAASWLCFQLPLRTTAAAAAGKKRDER